ncbi:MAG TPA: VWA domain-containing protein [Myxococcus sp.]|nr:VWA domain-containing protein [Myxococcus sp.]
MSPLKEFTTSTARPLPVILLADVSGSMSTDGKIDSLNTAVKEMLDTFAAEDDSRADIHVAVITFGQGGARLHQSLQPASQTRWEPMTATGNTPLGAALDVATSLLEDKARVPGRAWRPTLVLVSDGQPTDEWKKPLERLLASERAARATRFALGIGADADRNMLAAFLASPEARVFEAQEARQIHRFFQRVTMSVTTRSRSLNPDSAVPLPPEDQDDGLDY